MDIVGFIWNIADDCLRDVFQRGQYRDVILPMVVLRRFDALLEETKEDVEEELELQKKTFGESEIDEGAFTEITGYSFFNTSKWTLNRLKSTATNDNNLLFDNFVEYLNGYSANVKEVLNKFEFQSKAKRLADNDRLLSVIEKITDRNINLTNKPVLIATAYRFLLFLTLIWGKFSKSCFVDSTKKTTKKQENTLHHVMLFICWLVWFLNL